MGSPAFRRMLLDILPLPKLQKLAAIANDMHEMSVQVFDSKKKALLAGEEAALEQLGEGKDIMSIFCTLPRCAVLSISIVLTPNVQ